MIPDFKTYLGESVWGDIRKKSLGQEVRIEEDVNRMEPDEFVDYLRKHYSLTDADSINKIKYDGKFLEVPVFSYSPFITFLEIYYQDNELFLERVDYDKLKIDFPNFFIQLKKKYIIRIKNEGYHTEWIYLSPGDGSPISNSFFIDVLDTVIELVEQICSDNPEMIQYVEKKEDI